MRCKYCKPFSVDANFSLLARLIQQTQISNIWVKDLGYVQVAPPYCLCTLLYFYASGKQMTMMLLVLLGLSVCTEDNSKSNGRTLMNLF